MNYIKDEKKLIFADKVLEELKKLERWNNYNNMHSENVVQYEKYLVDIGKRIFEEYYEELLEPDFEEDEECLF